MEFEKLKDIIVDVMGCNPDEITMDTTFVDDLGADSLDLFELVMALEEEYGVEIRLIFSRLLWELKMHLISKLKMKMQKRSQQ